MIKPTNAILLKLHFNTQSVVAPTPFSLPWASSGS